MVFLAVAMQLAVSVPAGRCEPSPCVESSGEPVRARIGDAGVRFARVRPEWPEAGADVAGEATITDPSTAGASRPGRETGSRAGLVVAGGFDHHGMWVGERERSSVLDANLAPGLEKAEPPVGLRVRAGTDGRQLFDYSDGYYARLSLHRLASYGTLPLFAVQFFAGRELLNNVDHAAGWARAVHGPAAAGVAGLFLVNTVTGGLNIIEGLRDPNDRGWRVAHSLLMLAADAGFVWTGVTATGAGRYKPDSNELRTQHRTVALGSMGVATLGYLMMLSPFRRN